MLLYKSNPNLQSSGIRSRQRLLSQLLSIVSEEILRTNVAHWLSPDNRFVAYVQFNDTGVPLHRFPVYGDANDVYGSIREVSYPKVAMTIFGFDFTPEDASNGARDGQPHPNECTLGIDLYLFSTTYYKRVT